MPPLVLCDACVFFPVRMCDLFIRLHIEGVITLRWTRRIQEEWTRNAIEEYPTSENGIRKRATEMERAVDDWEIRGYEGVTHSGIIVSDPNDAHVLSAALHCGADYLVTANVRDFRASAEPPPIHVLSPDAFLCILSKSKLPELLLVLIEAQKHLSRPPKTMPEYLHGLREVGLIECSEVFKQEMLRLELS